MSRIFGRKESLFPQIRDVALPWTKWAMKSRRHCCQPGTVSIHLDDSQCLYLGSGTSMHAGMRGRLRTRCTRTCRGQRCD